MGYTLKQAEDIISQNSDLIGKSIFKTNVDYLISDIIAAPADVELFNDFIKEYIKVNDYKNVLSNINVNNNFRVLVISNNEFDSIFYYLDIE